MIPKIVFTYSSVYDNMFHSMSTGTYPSLREIKTYMKQVEKLWRNIEKKVFSLIQNISTLKWKEEKIKCYVVGKARCFSDPLTMRPYKNKKDFIDTLIHECIHQIIVQNKKELEKYWKALRKKYSEDTIVTQNHIALYAILEELHPKLFGHKKRREREIERVSPNPDYKRALEILSTEGGTAIKKYFTQKITKIR